MSHTAILISYTLASAIGIALLEGYLKWSSRATKAKPFPLTLDDADWWIEWVVSAGVALVIFLFVNAHEAKPVATQQLVTAIAAWLLGFSALPKLANIFCLNARGKVKSITWLVILNIVAVFILMATVAVGVKIYA